MRKCAMENHSAGICTLKKPQTRYFHGHNNFYFLKSETVIGLCPLETSLEQIYSLKI